MIKRLTELAAEQGLDPRTLKKRLTAIDPNMVYKMDPESKSVYLVNTTCLLNAEKLSKIEARLTKLEKKVLPILTALVESDEKSCD